MDHKIDARCLGFPPEEVMSAKDGLNENHAYEDVRGADVGTFREVYANEAELNGALASGRWRSVMMHTANSYR